MDATEVSRRPAREALAAEIANNLKRTVMEDLLTGDLSTIDRRSTANFADSRKTAKHREALYALRERRDPRYHDEAYMADLAARVERGEAT